jgi:hypothetical protein
MIYLVKSTTLISKRTGKLWEGYVCEVCLPEVREATDTVRPLIPEDERDEALICVECGEELA